MYLFTLTVHSWLRWVVLFLGLAAIVRAAAGLGGGRRFDETDTKLGRYFAIGLDVQIVLGLVLYGVLSPITQSAFAHMGDSMKNPILRFWAVEHIVMMLVALALAHVGVSRVRKAATDAAKHRVALIFFVLALVMVFAAIPWPFMADGRPLFRF
jgi:hypothetical protein